MHQDSNERPAAGTLHTKQINPGWAWYRVQQNFKDVAVIFATQAPTVTETWSLGKNYIEASPQFPKGVSMTFIPLKNQAEFEAVRQGLDVKKVVKHTLENL